MCLYKCFCVLIDSNGSLLVFIAPFVSLWILIGPYGSLSEVVSNEVVLLK